MPPGNDFAVYVIEIAEIAGRPREYVGVGALDDPSPKAHYQRADVVIGPYKEGV